MTKLRECLLLFMLIELQVTVSTCDGVHPDILMGQSETMKDVSNNRNQERSLDNIPHEYKLTMKNIKSSTLNDSYGLQYEQICRASGNQPCTCYYPDHPDVVQFQLGIDEITANASKVNGTGPSSCEDLRKLGHFLNGFYMIRLNTKRVKATYCVFNQTSESYLKRPISNSFNQINMNKSSSKVIRFCGGVKGKPCPFYYSDNPDSPQHGFEFSNEHYTKNGFISNITTKPASCKDLQLLGHYLNGFYMIHFNTVKVKIVYCNFKSLQSDNSEADIEKDIGVSSNSSKLCNDVGSQPCSCYMSNQPNILQLELSNDEITRAASNVNSTGPASCRDLKDFGHILDGFYMVRENSRIIKTVFCEFNEKENEKRSKVTVFNSTTPKTILLQPETKRTITKDFLSNAMHLPPYTQLGKFLPLINKHGLCLAVAGGIRPGKNDAKIIQSDCNSSEKGQLWKQNGNHLCNEWNKCMSTPLQRRPGSRAPYVIHLDLNHKDKRQEFRGTNESTIKNTDYCLGIQDNADYPGAEVKTDICNGTENGQIWNFVETELQQKRNKENINFKTTGSNRKKPIEQTSNSYLLTDFTSTSLKTPIEQLTTTKPASFQPSPLVFQTRTIKDTLSEKIFPLNHKLNISLLVRNNHGKCLAVDTNGEKSPGENGAKIVQSDCNFSEKGQRWKFQNSRLCNDWNKCITTSFEQNSGSRTFIVHWDPINDEYRQMWSAFGKNQFYNIGHFLGIVDDSDKTGAEAITDFRDERKKGQFWYFVHNEYEHNSNTDQHPQVSFPSFDFTESNQKKNMLQPTTRYPNTERSHLKLTSTKLTYLKLKIFTTLKHKPEVSKLVLEPKDFYRQLKNGHGMCLAVENGGAIRPSENGALVIQSDCNQLEKGQQWKITNKNHLCNQWNKCLSTPLNTAPGDLTSSIIQDEYQQSSKHQHWKYGKGGVLYNNGRCLSTINNSRNKGAAVQSYICTVQHEGQIWNFCSDCS